MKQQFGKQIKAAREAANLTQVELAKRIGVSGQSVSRMELGLQALRWRVLEALAEKLGQPPAYFFEVERPPAKPEKPAKLALFELVAGLDENQAKALLSETGRAADPLASRVSRLNPRDRQYVEDLVKGLEDAPSSPEPGKHGPEKSK